MPDKLRLKIGKTYISFFNRLPQFRGGFIRTFQDISEHHQKQAKETYDRTRPPKEVTVKLLYFRLIEAFNLENFDELRDGIFQLFPGLKDDFFDTFSAEAFTKQTESIHGAGWGTLGYVLRDKSKRWLGIDVYREITTLPPQVDFIEVQYQKILPSILLISLDVHLTEEADRELKSVQDKLYEPAIRFKSLLPWRSPLSGYSEIHSETEMRTAVLSWLEQIRVGVSDSFKPFLRGYFATQESKICPSLPTVEVYAVKGAPEDLQAFGEWSRKWRDWLDSLGFFLFWEVYTDDKLIFAPPDRSMSKRSSAYRILILWDSYVRSVGTNGHGGNEERAITYNTKYVLEGFAPLIILHEFLNEIEKSVAKLRRVTFRSMTNRIRVLGQYMTLNRIILRESILLDRMPMEFRQTKKLIEHTTRVIGAFKPLKPDFTTIDHETFVANSIANLEERMCRLKEQVEHMKHTFSDFLALKNMRAIYRLQIVVILLTIIALLANVIALLANWPNIKQFIKDVLKITL